MVLLNHRDPVSRKLSLDREDDSKIGNFASPAPSTWHLVAYFGHARSLTNSQDDLPDGLDLLDCGTVVEGCWKFSNQHVSVKEVLELQEKPLLQKNIILHNLKPCRGNRVAELYIPPLRCPFNCGLTWHNPSACCPPVLQSRVTVVHSRPAGSSRQGEHSCSRRRLRRLYCSECSRTSAAP